MSIDDIDDEARDVDALRTDAERAKLRTEIADDTLKRKGIGVTSARRINPNVIWAGAALIAGHFVIPVVGQIVAIFLAQSARKAMKEDGTSGEGVAMGIIIISALEIVLTVVSTIVGIIMFVVFGAGMFAWLGFAVADSAPADPVNFLPSYHLSINDAEPSN